MISGENKNSIIIDLLRAELKKPLPGFEAHRKMFPIFRADLNQEVPEHAKKGAVLILLYQKSGYLKLCLMKRPVDGSVHSGQISFPGGGMEIADKDLINTALRETEEEIGCSAIQTQILGILSTLYIPASNYSVLPVVGYYNKTPLFKINKSEVDELIEVKVETLLHPEICTSANVEARDRTYNVPVYDLGKHKIWGATAMILSEFLQVFRQISEKGLK
jgi:8-oxo-dGTP pyrophosphatase MutT (NUDIX family)